MKRYEQTFEHRVEKGGVLDDCLTHIYLLKYSGLRSLKRVTSTPIMVLSVVLQGHTMQQLKKHKKKHLPGGGKPQKQRGKQKTKNTFPGLETHKKKGKHKKKAHCKA